MGRRQLADEVAVALTYNGASYTVMMATPMDLEDFAVGFSVTEGVVRDANEIDAVEIREVESGIDARIWISGDAAERLTKRRRILAGPVGCGMCGLERLAAAMRPVPPVNSGLIATAEMIRAAIAALPEHQTLNHVTRAVHAAAFWTPRGGLELVREDVGRHNAFDKMAGGLLRQRIRMRAGMVLLTSRLSVELVQKAAMTGVTILVAVSAPTTLAVEVANSAGITLVAVARADGFEVFTHPHRVLGADLALQRAGGRPVAAAT